VTGWNRQAIAETLLVRVCNFQICQARQDGFATPFGRRHHNGRIIVHHSSDSCLRICYSRGQVSKLCQDKLCSRQCQRRTLFQFADESYWTRVRTTIRSWRITKPWISLARRSTAGASHDFRDRRAVSSKAGCLPVEESDMRPPLRFASPALFKRTWVELGERVSEGSC
jgi:hypothetical protein